MHAPLARTESSNKNSSDLILMVCLLLSCCLCVVPTLSSSPMSASVAIADVCYASLSILLWLPLLPDAATMLLLEVYASDDCLECYQAPTSCKHCVCA